MAQFVECVPRADLPRYHARVALNAGDGFFEDLQKDKKHLLVVSLPLLLGTER